MNTKISRIEELNRMAGEDRNCNYVKADFMKMPFSNNTFDAIFAIEATCHAPDVGEVELGNGLPELGQCLEALQLAGFEVIWENDVAVASPIPWYLPLDKKQFSLSSFRVTAVGRFITRNKMVVKEFRLSWRKQQMQLLKVEGKSSPDSLTASDGNLHTYVLFPRPEASFVGQTNL
ncbi:hypothetical protein OIU84_026388 [Salix udensis]|uniref:Methyltransferase type 11 domain-containing protein n=1 Tax=Salix udensis TaxID=889485 RepID=A0AAD6KLN4_9ROSI|nr:hypothetical protein OIU84_026388 [Salix udensis]